MVEPGADPSELRRQRKDLAELAILLDHGAAARVTRVLNSKAMDRTPVVWLEVPRAAVMDVRHFARKRVSR